MADDVLTFDDIRKALDALGPAPDRRSPFAIDDSMPLFPSIPSFFGFPLRVSPYGDLDPQPIRYRGWLRFRAWYEAFCRRIGAETPWQHLPTTTERSVLALAGCGFVVGPQTFSMIRSIPEQSQESPRS